MPKTCPSGLTKTDKGYCRTIGYHRNGSGRRAPRRFWLGHDRSVALRKAKVLVEAWEALPGGRGEKVWTETAIAKALDGVTVTPTAAVGESVTAGPVAVPVFAPRAVPPPDPRGSYTLPQALEQYAKWFGERNDISDYHRNGTKSRIASIKSHVEDIIAEEGGQTVRLADLSMSAVDMEWLSRIRNKVTSRPLTKHSYDTLKPISIDCVKGWLMALGMAFDWFDRTPRIGWTAPHSSWRGQFTLTKNQEYALRTPEERDQQGKPKPTFTLDEIVAIHKNAVPLERLYLQMGVFLGWSQEGIRSLRRPHLVKVAEAANVLSSRSTAITLPPSSTTATAAVALPPCEVLASETAAATTRLAPSMVNTFFWVVWPRAFAPAAMQTAVAASARRIRVWRGIFISGVGCPRPGHNGHGPRASGCERGCPCYFTGDANDASPRSTSAQAHQICTLATSCTYGGTSIVWLYLSPLIFRRCSRYVLPRESTTCQWGAGVSGILKSSDNVRIDLPSRVMWVA